MRFLQWFNWPERCKLNLFSYWRINWRIHGLVGQLTGISSLPLVMQANNYSTFRNMIITWQTEGLKGNSIWARKLFRKLWQISGKISENYSKIAFVKSTRFVHLQFDVTGVVVCVCVGKHCTGLVIDTWLGNEMLYPAEKSLNLLTLRKKGF